MLKEKKIPMRQCVGCREMRPKRELIRVVRSKEGVVALDFNGRLPGRGAYICKDCGCMAKAKKAKALDRAFSCRIPDEVYDELERVLSEEENAE